MVLAMPSCCFQQLPFSCRLCCAGYIGEFEIVDDHRAGKIVVEVRLMELGSLCVVPRTELWNLTVGLMPGLECSFGFIEFSAPWRKVIKHNYQ